MYGYSVQGLTGYWKVTSWNLLWNRKYGLFVKPDFLLLAPYTKLTWVAADFSLPCTNDQDTEQQNNSEQYNGIRTTLAWSKILPGNVCHTFDWPGESKHISKLFETVGKSDPAGPKEKEPSRFGQNYQLTSPNVCDLLFGLQLVRTGSWCYRESDNVQVYYDPLQAMSGPILGVMLTPVTHCSPIVYSKGCITVNLMTVTLQ